MKTLIIYNSLAGKKSRKDKIIKNFLNKNDLSATWHYTDQGSFTHLDPNSYERIFACGGDGTIKEVSSWIINHNCQTPLAIIPIGSANILALSLGLPLETKKALRYGLTDNVQKIDIGLVNNRHYFLIAAGCGFDAKVIKNTSRKMKKAWGWGAYIISILLSLFSAKANKFLLKIDDKTITANAQSIFISNFARFFNLTINPKASINDGYLNISILKTLQLQNLAILLFRLLIGRYKKDMRYEYYTAKRVYVLPFYKKTPIQIDGEVVDLPYLDIKIKPKALNIIAKKLP